jgi:hypothetical protein
MRSLTANPEPATTTEGKHINSHHNTKTPKNPKDTEKKTLKVLHLASRPKQLEESRRH